MSKKNENIKNNLLNYSYDGIQELDNNLPKWWLILFSVTIIFGIIYFCYYQLWSGPSLKDEYREEIAKIEAQKMANNGAGSFPDLAKAIAAEKSEDSIKQGKAIFVARCLPCHGDKGQGIIGPNLTDHFWIHGNGKIADIVKVIHDGVPEKGMQAWGLILPEKDIYLLGAFVRSLRGTKPDGAKAPQGQEYQE